MTTYEKLKKIIIEEIPEIMELKFGCEVIYKEKGDDYNKHYICLGSTGMMTDIHQGCYGYYDFKEKGKKSFEESFSKIHRKWHIGYNFEIIGRDITLSDCLMVLAIKRCNENFFVSTLGNLFQEKEDGSFSKICDWQLGKPFHEQSEETLTFLLEILDK